MGKTALFIRHQAQPGRRDDALRVWEKHLKPRVESNPAHEAYFSSYNSDPNAICVFQLYRDSASMKESLSGACYGGYLGDVSQFIAAQPQITPAALVWASASCEARERRPRQTLAGEATSIPLMEVRRQGSRPGT